MHGIMLCPGITLTMATPLKISHRAPVIHHFDANTIANTSVFLYHRDVEPMRYVLCLKPTGNHLNNHYKHLTLFGKE